MTTTPTTTRYTDDHECIATKARNVVPGDILYIYGIIHRVDVWTDSNSTTIWFDDGRQSFPSDHTVYRLETITEAK